MHGGTADNSGRNNGNWKHGAFSKHFRRDLTDAEKEALKNGFERLHDPETARSLAIELAVESALKYKRTGDPRFLREFRQMCEAFNITPSDELTLSVDGLEAAFMEDLRGANGE